MFPRVLAIGAVLVALAACACTVSEPKAAAPSSRVETARLLGPPAFAEEIQRGKRVVINVHVPDEGSIPGIDLAIPFNRLEQRASELPPDRSTPLAVYCRSGSMSATAARTLADMGYTDVVDLLGGMIAWQRSGRVLLPPGGGS